MTTTLRKLAKSFQQANAIHAFRSLLCLAVLAVGACSAGNSRDALPWLSTSPPSGTAPLDGMAAISRDIANKKSPDFATTPVPKLREMFEEGMAKRPQLNEPVARVEDRRISGPAGYVPVRVYTPNAKLPCPIILYIHGGGFTLGSINSYNDLCRSLCHRGGVVVVSVDYRLAPETKYPGGLDDCFAALKWTAEHASEIGGDPARISVAGDSAGGNLSAALSLRVRDSGGPRIARQILIYPGTNAACDTASYYNFATGYGVTREQAIYFYNWYLSSPAERELPYVSPLRAENLRNLPPALIVTAQYDIARDDGEAYAARLHEAGVPVKLTRYLGMTHGFVNMGGVFPQARTALDQIARAASEP